jgi:succinate dehydrogenase/fumarate reductase flavoprotein subunit
VLATGGFQGNSELLTRYVLRNPSNLYLRSNPWSTGDAFLAATQIGAAASPGMHNIYGHALAAPPARFTKWEFRDVSQHYGQKAVAINLRGERFCDESLGGSEDMLNQSLIHQPEGRGFYIIDHDLYDSKDMHASKVVTRVIVERARAAGAPVVVADTLEELARKLSTFGIPAPRVLRELTEFNHLLQSGCGDDLLPPRKLHRLPLARAPFYAIAVKASITFTMGGLQIDNHGRVMRRSASSSVLATVPAERALDDSDSQVKRIDVEYRQTVIEGLYAAGCDVGNISHFEYAGGLAPALATGRVAGRNAGAFVKRVAG